MVFNDYVLLLIIHLQCEKSIDFLNYGKPYHNGIPNTHDSYTENVLAIVILKMNCPYAKLKYL